MLQRNWRTSLLRIFLFFMVAFMISPVFFVILSSFNSVAYNSFPPKGFSFRWYANVFKSTVFTRAFYKSVVVAGMTALVSCIAGTMASFAIVRYRFIGRGACKSMVYTPIITPKLAIGLSSFILALRLKIYGNLASIVICHTVISLPYVISMISASLAGLDTKLEEAAMDLGAVPRQVLSKVIFPQIKSGLAVGAGFAFLRSFEQVNATIFLLRPGDNTLPVEMFLYLERFQDPTISAVATVLIGITIAVVSIAGFGDRGLEGFGVGLGAGG